MGEWMEGKEVDIMQGTQITKKVVEPGRRTVGEGEIIITMTEVGTEDEVEETTEEVAEVIIMEVVEAMPEEIVGAADITVKSTEAEEEIVPVLQEVVETTVPVIKMVITIGQWRIEVVVITGVKEIATVTPGGQTKQVVVGEEVAVLIMVADMTNIVIGKEAMVVITTTVMVEEETIGAVAEEGDLQSTLPKSWR